MDYSESILNCLSSTYSKIPLNSLSSSKQQLLNSCVNFPKFYIKMYDDTFRHEGVTIYICEYGYIKKSDVIYKLVKFRYSTFEKFYNHITKTYKSYTFDPFPCKRWIWNNSDSNIKDRVIKFKNILERLNMIYSINEDSEFKKFFDVNNETLD